MAKKRKKADPSKHKVEVIKKRTEYLDEISNDVNGTIAKIVSEGHEVLAQIKDLNVISLSPSLDEGLGGGLQEGTSVIIAGPPKCGKSVSALSFCAHAQQKYNKAIYYLDTEVRLSRKHLEGIKGLDVDKIKVIGPTEEQPEVTAEMYLRTLEMLVRRVPNVVCVVDSVSNMLPEDEMANEIRTGIRAGLPKLMTQFLKRTAGDVVRNGAIIIFILHKIANTGATMPGAPKTLMDGGNQIQYQASTILEFRGKNYWRSSTEDIGLEVDWTIKTSALDGIPGTVAKSWIRWGVGIDRSKEILDIACDLSIASNTSGGRYAMTLAMNNQDDKRVQAMIKRAGVDPEDSDAVEKLFKFHGVVNVLEWMDANPEIVEMLEEEIEKIPL